MSTEETLKEKLVRAGEISAREMVRIATAAREQRVSPNLSILESRVELTEEETSYTMEVATDWTLPQPATRGGLSAPGGGTTYHEETLHKPTTAAQRTKRMNTSRANAGSS